jgi:hypothetical protein
MLHETLETLTRYKLDCLEFHEMLAKLGILSFFLNSNKAAKLLISVLVQVLDFYCWNYEDKHKLRSFLKEWLEHDFLRGLLIQIAQGKFEEKDYVVKWKAKTEAVQILLPAADLLEVRAQLIALLPQVLKEEDDVRLLYRLLRYIKEEVGVVEKVVRYLGQDESLDIWVDLRHNIDKYGYGAINGYAENPTPELLKALETVSSDVVNQCVSGLSNEEKMRLNKRMNG